MRSIPLAILLVSCQQDAESLDVGAYTGVDNRTDAKLVFDDGPEGELPNRVELHCAAETRAMLNAAVDEDGVLVIQASGELDTGDCRIHVPASGIRTIVVKGDGDLVSDAVFTDLELLEVRGSGVVDLWAVHTPWARFDVSGNGDVTIGELLTEDVDFDLSGNGTFRVAGATEHAHLKMSGHGVFLGHDFVIEELDAEISGSARAEVTVTDVATVAVSGSGSLSVEGGADVFHTVTGNGSISVY